MFGKLLSTAKDEGIQEIKLCLLLHKPDGILLLEKFPINQSGFYEPPQGVILDNESINQALERVVMESTNLKLESVEKLLCYFDDEKDNKKTRRYYFIGKAKDPESINLSAHRGFSWLAAEDAVGYPISDELRQVFDLYMKT